LNGADPDIAEVADARKRQAGENHNDAIALFKTIKYGEEINTNAN
jgi:hypothetical protein